MARSTACSISAQASKRRPLRASERSTFHHGSMRHYRATLDQPIGMLGGKTPRACARTKAGRQKVAAWLKFLESESGRKRRAGDPLGSYDFGWMWAELGIADLRR